MIFREGIILNHEEPIITLNLVLLSSGSQKSYGSSDIQISRLSVGGHFIAPLMPRMPVHYRLHLVFYRV